MNHGQIAHRLSLKSHQNETIFLPNPIYLSTYLSNLLWLEKFFVLDNTQRHIKNPVKHFKMEPLAKIVNSFKSLTIFGKCSILDVEKILNTLLVPATLNKIVRSHHGSFL